MDNQVKSVFQFDEYKVDFIDYKLNPNFHYSEPLDIKSKIDIQIGVSDDSHQGRVTLNATIFDDAEQNNYPFYLKVSITGYFSSPDVESQDELRKFCEINGTAALFPFFRSAVADITKTANVDPLLFPLVNIYNLIEEQKSLK